MRLINLIPLLFLSAILTACSGGVQIDQKTQLKKELDGNLNIVSNAVLRLSQSLENGTVTNAVILKTYAKTAKEKKPAFADVIDVLASEGTTKGPTYQSLVDRLKTARAKVNDSLHSVEAAQILNMEFRNIATATNNYDAMLVDAINVLSDFTDGQLPKLRELEFAGEKKSSAEPGSEYVGNANYGSWKQNSSGSSVWEWYGKYAMFSALFSRPVYYDSWSSNRRPSYYHDYGRTAYSSPSGRRNQTETLQRTKKTYSAKGQKFQSSYAKAQPTIKGSGATKPAFKSSYASQTNSTRKTYGATTGKSKYANASSSGRKSSSTSSYSSGYKSRSSGSSRSSSRGGK